MKILSGKIARQSIKENLLKEIGGFSSMPCLVIIQVGNLLESNSYIEQKKKFADAIGIKVEHIRFTATSGERQIIEKIMELNDDPGIHGIIVQLPLPRHLGKENIIAAIDPLKDVDGLTLESEHIPATARGVMTLLRFYDIDPTAKKVTVVGRSDLVGKPIADLLQKNGAIVTVCHKETPKHEMKEACKTADILIVAAGSPKLITGEYVREGQVIVDVGITIQNGKLVGDVDFESVKDIVSAITPVPGGVGPMTVLSLFENVVDAYKKLI